MTETSLKKLILYLSLLMTLIFAACTKQVPKLTQDLPQPEANNQDTRFGLPESIRREIYEELQRSEINAEGIAKKRFPGRGSLVLTPELPLVKKRGKAIQAVLTMTKSAIAAKYNITVSEVEEIVQEGKENHWAPFLPIPRLDYDWHKIDPGWQILPADSI